MESGSAMLVRAEQLWKQKAESDVKVFGRVTLVKALQFSKQ